MPGNWSFEGKRTFLLESQVTNKPFGINRINYPFDMHKLFVLSPFTDYQSPRWILCRKILMEDSPRMKDK
jgi:hypothetical protein